jgi:hypothetical protein
MQVFADYPPSSQIPAKTQTFTTRPASPADDTRVNSLANRTNASQSDRKAPEMTLTFEIPAPIRSWLLGVPVWKWIIGMLILVVLLIIIDKFKESKKRRRFQSFQEPE